MVKVVPDVKRLALEPNQLVREATRTWFRTSVRGSRRCGLASIAFHDTGHADVSAAPARKRGAPTSLDHEGPAGKPTTDTLSPGGLAGERVIHALSFAGGPATNAPDGA